MAVVAQCAMAHNEWAYIELVAVGDRPVTLYKFPRRVIRTRRNKHDPHQVHSTRLFGEFAAQVLHSVLHGLQFVHLLRRLLQRRLESVGRKRLPPADRRRTLSTADRPFVVVKKSSTSFAPLNPRSTTPPPNYAHSVYDYICLFARRLFSVLVVSVLEMFRFYAKLIFVLL